MTESDPRPTRRWLKGGVIAAVIVVLLAAGGVYWFFSGDAPPEADLQATASAVASTSDAATTTATAGIDGTWQVDTTIGDFTITGETTATFAGFRIQEVLAQVGSTTAVGRSPDVTGSVVIDGDTAVSAEVTVDLTSIVSDQSRRDDAIQRSLGTNRNPDATFTLTDPIELGSAAVNGEVVTTTASGDLTINGVTNRVEIPIEAQLVDGNVLVVGSMDIVFADYDVQTPTAQAVVSVEDHGILELQLWLTR